MALLLATGPAAAVLLAGCESLPALTVEVPSPSGAAAEACRALAQRLPDAVADEKPRRLADRSPYVAAWGDPAVVLRCGVSRPAKLDPGSGDYAPGSDAVLVDDVSWLLEEGPDEHRFTTVERTVFVEVTVPAAYAPEVNALVDLAGAVTAAIPLDPLWADYYERENAG
jgi:hypothetical protein